MLALAQAAAGTLWPMVHAPSSHLPDSLPPAPPPVPWSPSMGRRPSPPRLRLEQDADAPIEKRTPAERQSLIETLRRRSAIQNALSRAAAALAVAVAVAVTLMWAPTQTWWSPTLLARLPQPAAFTGWLRQPTLSVLPGLSPEWNPWAPLTLQEPETLLTRWKLNQLEGDPTACQAWLAAVPATDETPLPQHTDADTLLCGWKTASRVGRLDGVRYSSPFPLACGAVVALARWQRHTLQPAARALLGSEVVRIDHLGSYACRTIGSGAAGRLSTHASANALDIARFTLADGRTIGIAQDWPQTETRAAVDLTRAAHATGREPPSEAEGEASVKKRGNPKAARASTAPTAKAAFLQAARDGACSSFNAVLGPDYNAAHSDHFHLDRGADRVCR